MNALHSKPWSIVPSSAPTDSFVLMTETAIIKQIDPRMLERFTGLTKEQWLTNGNQGMREPQGSFLKAIFGPQLGGNFKCGHTGQVLDNQDQYRYLLKTSFKTDGFSVQCHVLDLKRPKKPTFVPKGDVMTLAKLNPRSKKETPVDLPLNHSFSKIIGVDFGQTYAGGFVCKDYPSYSVDYGTSSQCVSMEAASSGQSQSVSMEAASSSQSQSMSIDVAVSSGQSVSMEAASSGQGKSMDVAGSSFEGEDEAESNQGPTPNKPILGYDGAIRNLKIKSSALSEPTRLYQNYLKHAKREFQTRTDGYVSFSKCNHPINSLRTFLH